MLNERAKVVGTPDELESFFHVILYYAVRYLVSNCSDAGIFVEDFFESYSLVNKKYFCGQTKRTAMYLGKLVLDDTDSSLKFSSPLDWFLLRLLALFKAHYAVVQHKKKQAEKVNTVEPALLAADEPFDMPVILDEDAEPLYPLAESPSQEHEDSLTDDDKEPDAVQVALSRQVQSHDCLVDALKHAVVLRGWKRGDRVKGDNVSPFYTPQYPVGPRVSSAKRLRTGTLQAPPS